MSVRVGIVGAAGRMGELLQRAARDVARFRVGALVVAPVSEVLGKPSLFGEPHYSGDLREHIERLDSVMDFSTPEQSVHTAGLCAEFGLPLLVGVTGHSAAERAAIERAGSRVPVAVVPNTSLGVVVLHEAVARVARLLGEDFDVEICESHHRAKRDAPSGTALSLAQRVERERPGSRVLTRGAGAVPRAAGEIGIVALRGGDTPGEHAVHFFGDGERIELHHRVRDRAVFASGAFRLLERLVDRAPGVYTAASLLGLEG